MSCGGKKSVGFMHLSTVPTLYVSDHKQRSYLEFKVAKSCVMSAIAVERLLT